MDKIEILAPASSREALEAEIHAGADAVYVGGMKFGARAFADNLAIEQLQEAIDFVHLYGRKLYLTVNTLLNDEELEHELFDLINPLYEQGLDAVIVQDVGVMSYVHEAFPELDIHASTQMTILDGESAEFFRCYGVTRYVAARELTIEQIKKCCAESDLEVEAFVHGALCYCYSGQCLMSSVIGGRSGNRGMCAQPCRLLYHDQEKAGYFLSPKDVCTLEYIPELAEAGINSFKIEGRMKSKEYGAFITHLYRTYLDFYLKEGKDAFKKEVGKQGGAFEKDIVHAMDIYNRGGFCSGYLFEKDKRNMIYPKKNNHFGTKVGEVISIKKNRAEVQIRNEIHYQDVLEFRNDDGSKEYEYTVKEPVKAGGRAFANFLHGSRVYTGQEVYRTRNNTLLQSIERFPHKKIKVKGFFQAFVGQAFRLVLEAADTRICTKGGMTECAVSKPVEADEIKKRLLRTGETPYEFGELDIQMDANVFIPLGQCNQLRREALAALEEGMLAKRRRASGTRPVPLVAAAEQKKNEILVSVCTMDQLEEVIRHPAVTIIHCQLADFDKDNWGIAFERIKVSGKRAAYSFPRIWSGECTDKVIPKDSIPIVNSWGMWCWLKKGERVPEMLTDANLYVTNRRAFEVYRQNGAEGFIAPLDAGKKEKKEYDRLGGFITVYGKIPVMVSKVCLSYNMGSCQGKNGHITIKGPKGDKFLVVNDCKYCYNTIYTDKVYWDKNTYSNIRFNFIEEEADTVKEVFRQWKI